jgi:hypothetical protein
VIEAVRQHRLIDVAVIVEISLAVAGEGRCTNERWAFDRRLEKAARPRFVVHIDGILESVALWRTDLNRTENGGKDDRAEHQTTASEIPIPIVPA